MTRVVRLGAVSYLNARPLVYGLRESAMFDLRFDLPAVCAQLLAAGRIDLGLVPSITFAAGDAIVPGLAIASDGPVASVAIFTRVPPSKIRTLALDTSSRTSVALTRILCRRRLEIAPEFVPHAPDLSAMLDACDAALLIGDPALFADGRALGAEKLDLGQMWTEWTGLPFVWACWVGRASSHAIDAGIVARLQAAREEGLLHSDAVADEFCAGEIHRRDIARRYLRESIRYELDDRMLRGLETYYREAAALGLIAAVPPLRFFPVPNKN